MQYQYCGLDGKFCVLKNVKDSTDLYRISVAHYPELLSKLRYSGDIIDLIELSDGIELIFPLQENQFRQQRLTIYFNEGDKRGKLDDERTVKDNVLFKKTNRQKRWLAFNEGMPRFC